MQLKKDLEFANAEIERLRSKLVVDDEDMPALTQELFGNSKFLSKSFMENEIDGSTNEFNSLKEAITQASSANPNSRNEANQ